MIKTKGLYVSPLSLGLVSLIALTGTILFTPASYADNDTAVDDVNINVPITCTLSGSGMNSHNATINPGTSNSAIGTTNMNVVCNDSNGFAIYAIGYTNDTDGDNTLTSTTLSPAQTIATGTALSGNSQWAMKLATVTSPTPAYPITIMNSFDSFHTVPDDYTLVAKRTSATDMGQNAVGSSFSSTYQAYISSSQPADTYQGQVKYVMVHPYDHATPVESLCASNQLEMQNVSQWESTVTAGNEVTACDNRDGKTYTVARLADGNLWMNQNLDFDIVNGGANLNSTNTDVPSNWADAGNLTNTYATNNTSWGAVSDPLSNPESYDPGDLCWDGTVKTSYSPDNTLANSTIACTQSGSHLHVGNYYNWTAALAMVDSSSYITEFDGVEQSICPAGWTLPSTDSFAGLKNQANPAMTVGPSGNIHINPYYFVYGGDWSGHSSGVGTGGTYWASTIEDDYSAYLLHFNIGTGTLIPNSYGPRSSGRLVRCVSLAPEEEDDG